MKYLAVLTLLLGCSGPWFKTKSPTPDNRVANLKETYAYNQARASGLRDPVTHWLARQDCDGMIWAGKYAATVKDVDITAAEYPEEPGRFSRRPFPACWTLKDGDQGSATTWSRDMGVAGLFPYAYLSGRRDILERHGAYGKAHQWTMGEPLADGRTVYTPGLIGMIYKTIFAMGGPADPNALWPDVYPAGLTDYEAHLQVMTIWLQGEVATKLHDLDAVPRRGAGLLDVTGTMYQRLEEHAAAEPSNPLYSYVLGKYTGDQNHTLDLLLDPAMPLGSYVRCADLEQCRLAEWLFTASLLLQDFAALN